MCQACNLFVIFTNLKEMVQILLKPVNFQFHLIAGSKAISAPNVRGMHNERTDTQNAFTTELEYEASF
jgi:hypothetical protein